MSSWKKLSHSIWVLGSLCVGLALAGDGVLEINQACAMNGGCFSGDNAGFPVTITSSGSYVLTSNLSITGLDTNGIWVQSDRVSIDLNGFTVAGPATCSGAGSTLTCDAGTGLGIGVENLQELNSTIVRDGNVIGFAGNGVRGWKGSQVTHVVAEGNGGAGISVIGGIVTLSTAIANQGDGITGSTASVLHNNVARENGGNGILVSFGVATGNTARLNGLSGIHSSSYATMRDNSVTNNEGLGITCVSNCTIIGNTVIENTGGGIDSTLSGSVVRDNTVAFNGGDGIKVGSASLVSGNVVASNTADGIEAGASSAVQHNVSRFNSALGLNLDAASTFLGNTTGNISGGVNMGQNSCNGTTTCP